MVPQYANQDPLGQIFLALAHPVRRQILLNLKTGKSSVTELSKTFNISMPAITRHIKVLEKSGLISKTIDAQTRLITMDTKPLTEILDWLGGYIPMITESYNRLETFLQQSITDDKDNKNNAKNG